MVPKTALSDTHSSVDPETWRFWMIHVEKYHQIRYMFIRNAMIDHEKRKKKKLKNHQGYDIWEWVKLCTYILLPSLGRQKTSVNIHKQAISCRVPTYPVDDLMWVKQCHKPSPSHHHFYRWYGYAQTPRFAHTPSMLYTWGYQTLDFTFNWEDQQGYLGNINFPPPLNFTFIEDLQ